MKLIHYTSLDKGLNHILDKMKLRFGPLSSTNDPYEYKKRGEGLIASNEMSEKDTARMMSVIINFNNGGVKVGCFVAESQNNWKVGKGIRKSRMWAQYGSNHSGIAFVFDQESLLGECKTHVTNQWAIFNDKVEYPPYNRNKTNPCWANLTENSINSSSGMIEEHLFQNAKSYWYKKDKDWEDEQEYRIMMFTKNPEFEYINIAPSLEAVILGDRADETMMSKYFNDKRFEIYRLDYNSRSSYFELKELHVNKR